MSLLYEINKKKAQLNSCSTKLTLSTGQVYKEQILPDGSITCIPLEFISPGYVVDTQPDMQMVEVLPYLWMGSQDVARDRELMLSHKITHVLSVGVMLEGLDSDFECCFVQALDLPETNLVPILEQSISFIDESRLCGGSVFIHCNAGVSRSASIVIGYLIKEGMSFNNAYQYLKDRRKVIKPNCGFIKQLKEYEARVIKKSL